jgi:hypothetical protein
VTVTVCGKSQLFGVNVTLARSATPSAGFDDAIGIVTSYIGFAVSLTVNVACVPDSDVRRPATGVTIAPA